MAMEPHKVRMAKHENVVVLGMVVSGIYVPMYQATQGTASVRRYADTLAESAMVAAKRSNTPRGSVEIECIQTGVRIEKRLLKVLKGLAETLDLSLGDLLEGIALHALENKPPFSASTLKKIADLKRVYGLDLGAANSHRLHEKP